MAPSYCNNITVSALLRVSLLFAWPRLCQNQLLVLDAYGESRTNKTLAVTQHSWETFSGNAQPLIIFFQSIALHETLIFATSNFITSYVVDSKDAKDYNL